MNPIFKSGSPRFFFPAVVLCVALVVADVSTNGVREARAYISLLLTPLQWVVDIPNRFADGVSDVVVSHSTLLKENERLKSEVLQLEQNQHKIEFLRFENQRLRRLLDARQRVADDVELVELIGVNPDPFQHQVVIDRGSEDGVVVGQPVLDAGGVFGQVVETAPYTSRVMQLTDARHALPVEINRNGYRSIALGKGEKDELELEHVSDTVDIRQGDLLVSSGLGKRFPRGYPVAIVTDVIRDPGREFSKVVAKPLSFYDTSRHLLLVKAQERTHQHVIPANEATSARSKTQ
ncbi:MAG: rod shape-determining protein MreC, partial [Pontibacterium sp.]